MDEPFDYATSRRETLLLAQAARALKVNPPKGWDKWRGPPPELLMAAAEDLVTEVTGLRVKLGLDPNGS